MGVTTSIWDQSTLALIKTYLGGDEHTNDEPIHNDATDVDSTDWNKIVSGLGEVALRTINGNILDLHFYQSDCTAGQTNVDLQRSADTVDQDFVAPLAGSVIAISISIENAVTVDDCIVTWTKNGTEGVLQAKLDTVNTLKHYASQEPGTETFDAGDLVGVSVTTDALFAAGVTPTISVDLIIALGE